MISGPGRPRQDFLPRVGDANDKHHEVLDGDHVVVVRVHHPHQFGRHAAARPDLEQRTHWRLGVYRITQPEGEWVRGFCKGQLE